MRRPRFKRLDPNTVVLLKQIAVGLLVLSVVGLIVAGIWYGTRLEAFTIDTVTASGGETIPLDTVREVAEQELEGVYLGLVPRRFTYWYPQEDIEAAVADVPRAHNVVVSRPSRTEVQITFDEYIADSLWCASVTSDDCVFIDENGYAFARAPQLRGGAFLRFSHLTKEPTVGTSTVPAATLTTAASLVERLDAIGWPVYHVELQATNDAFMHIVGGGELKVNLETPPAKTVENFQVILTSDEFEGLAPGNFAYVDLRYGNKVFVQENLAAPDVDTASSTASSSESADAENGSEAGDGE